MESTALPFRHRWKKLQYEIHECTNRSATNVPEKIMIHNENDPSSRWTSSHSGMGLVGLWLKLKRMSVAYAIKFGKCSKLNGCFMKDFKVYGGVEKNKMILLLDASLRYDEEAETFMLRFTLPTSNTIIMPILYLKLCPISAWGTSNHLPSIYFVELIGENDQTTVQHVYSNFMAYLEKESLRLCLTHLRTRHLRHEPIPEPKLVTELFKKCEAGEWDQIETLLCGNVRGWGINAKWYMIGDKSIDTNWPCGRAGHQMVVSGSTETLYLLGGYNGKRNLADFWSWSINDRQWRLITENTELDGGPSARSLFKMVLDELTGRIFILGGYHDPSIVVPKSDFYCWNNNVWIKLSEDTEKDGGPQFVSNLEMCIDSTDQVLYVFGGRFQSTYESLYKYEIRYRKWTRLRSENTPSNGMPLKPRTECCMLFHPIRKQIFILGGNRGKDPLRDFYLYDINSDTVMEISRDISLQGGPTPLNIVKGVINYEKDEIYVMAGATRQSTLENPETIKNEFWVYRIANNTWHLLEIPLPRARTAQSIQYYKNKIYMFGGREGDNSPVDQRLGDFWEMRINGMGDDEALRKAKFLIRKYRYLEMCLNGNNMDPLLYLRSHVHEMVNHQDPAESLQFRELASNYMFNIEIADKEWTFKHRIKLFDELMSFFPDMQNNSRSIIDMVIQYESNL
jgi:hypothetical protein